MDPFPWVVYQLLSYSPGSWFLFLAIAALTGYFGRLLGILTGHVLIAALILCLDFLWIQAAMAAPGWDGSPDQDAVFLFGVVLRIVMINTCLLPISVGSMIASHRRENPKEQPAPELTRPD